MLVMQWRISFREDASKLLSLQDAVCVFV